MQSLIPLRRTGSWIAAFIVAASTYGLTAQDSPEGEKPATEEKRGDVELQGIPWAASFEKAVETSRENELPMMVDFGAEWCGWCKKLDRDTFGNLKVIEAVRANFVAVKVDTDKQPDLAKKYGAQSLPTIVFLAPGAGEELHRLEGYREPDVFLKDIAKPAASSKTLKDLKAALEKDPKNLDLRRAYARAVFALGNQSDAAEQLSAALADHPEHPGLLLDLADVMHGSGKRKEARELYERLLALSAGAASAEQKAAQLPYGRLLVSLRDHRAAIDAFASFIAANPPSDAEDADNSTIWEAHFWRGYAHAVLKDAKSALADLQAVREKDQGPWGLRANYIIDIVESAN